MPKKDLRVFFRKMRKLLPEKRRQEARLKAFNILSQYLTQFRSILSFASMKEEIDLWKLNQHLAEKNLLHLPRIKHNFLEIYLVKNIPGDLLQHKKLSLLEPNPILCKKVELKKLDCVLVPGLAFDPNLHRLGYGKGYYDRLLKKLPKKTIKIGIGYQEQYSNELLPTSKTDYSLDLLFLF